MNQEMEAFFSEEDPNSQPAQVSSSLLLLIQVHEGLKLSDTKVYELREPGNGGLLQRGGPDFAPRPGCACPLLSKEGTT